MYPRKRRPPKHKDPSRHQQRPHYGRRQAELGLTGALNTRLSLELIHKFAADAVPQRVRHDAQYHADHDTGERQPNLPGIEAVVRAPKYERKGPEEQVQDAEKDSGEQTQVQTHGLKDEQLKGPQQRLANGTNNRPLDLVGRGCPAVITRFFAQVLRLFLEENRIYWDRERGRKSGG